MSDTWTALVHDHGRKSVMSLAIDDTMLDAETERQATEIFPLIRAALRGNEQTALDYGCGYGRFTRHLARMVKIMAVGYDPCVTLIKEARRSGGAIFVSCEPKTFAAANIARYDVVFTAMVLGDPGINLRQSAVDLVSMLAPDGLLCVLDHMPDVEPPGRWWRFRPRRSYVDLFDQHDIRLRTIGMVRQLNEPVTILAGRRP